MGLAEIRGPKEIRNPKSEETLAHNLVAPNGANSLMKYGDFGVVVPGLRLID